MRRSGNASLSFIVFISVLCSLSVIVSCDFSQTIYTLSLSPNQVVNQPVLPENENSFGTGYCILDRYAEYPELTCYLQHNVDEVFNITINYGQRGETGEVLYVFPANQGYYTIGTFQLNNTYDIYQSDYSNTSTYYVTYDVSQKVDDFLNGYWYIQIVTLDFPVGQIRGQIEHIDRFYSHLLTSNTIPRSTGSHAHGIALATTAYYSARELTFSIVSDVTGGKNFAFGVGQEGTAGSVFLTDSYSSVAYPTIDLSITEAQNLYDDMLFLSVLSTSNPNGDIRGQLISIDYVSFPSYTASLTGSNAATTSSSVGVALFSYDCYRGVLEYVILHTVTNATEAKINVGAVGSLDSNLFVLPSGNSPIYGSEILTTDDYNYLTNGVLFVSIYSYSYQEYMGEIRGQITANTWSYFAYLSGTNVVPPVTTSATGLMLINLIATNQTNTQYQINYELIHTATDATLASLYYGSYHQNGRKLIDLPSHQSPTSFTVTITQDYYNAIAGGSTYILIDSSVHPFGVLRGEIRALESCTLGGISDQSPETTLNSSEEALLQSSNDVIVVYVADSSSISFSYLLFICALVVIFIAQNY